MSDLGANVLTFRNWFEQSQKPAATPPTESPAALQVEVRRLRQELELVTEQRHISKKISRHPLHDVSHRYQHIEQLSAQHRVSVLCELLSVACNGYYAWRHNARPAAARRRMPAWANASVTSS